MQVPARTPAAVTSRRRDRSSRPYGSGLWRRRLEPWSRSTTGTAPGATVGAASRLSVEAASLQQKGTRL